MYGLPLVLQDASVKACVSLDPDAITAAHNALTAWHWLQDQVGGYCRNDNSQGDVYRARVRFNDALAALQATVAHVEA